MFTPVDKKNKIPGLSVHSPQMVLAFPPQIPLQSFSARRELVARNFFNWEGQNPQTILASDFSLDIHVSLHSERQNFIKDNITLLVLHKNLYTEMTLWVILQ